MTRYRVPFFSFCTFSFVHGYGLYELAMVRKGRVRVLWTLS